MTRGMGFERFMLFRIAGQQAWAARGRGEAASDAVGERVAECGGAGEAEIVVRGEVDAGARGEGAATNFGRERGKIGAVDGEGDVAARHARAPYNDRRLPETVYPGLVDRPFSLRTRPANHSIAKLRQTK